MTFRVLNADERFRFRRGEAPPVGRKWITSPCLLICEIENGSDEALLLDRLDGVSLEVAMLGLDPDPCMLVDFYCAYGMYEQLVQACEASQRVTDYVLAIPAWQDTSGKGSFDHVPYVHDLAGSVAARRAALEAL